ncbi:MAG: SAM-dependent methyltransferase [Clostridia bacterium]|nr:SAM-dependent methyltransferase [Clostridia bacterium]
MNNINEKESAIEKAMELIGRNDLNRIVVSSPKQKNSAARVVIRPTIVKGEYKFIVESYRGQKVFHSYRETIDGNYILSLIECYKNVNILTEGNTLTLMSSINGKVTVITSPNNVCAPALSHDREKNYVINEGMEIGALVDLGVFTTDFRVVKSKYDKFKQINRFVEIVNDVVAKCEDNLRITDYGCGKSYLSFVLYYYFTHIIKKNVDIIGYDLKSDVVENCNKLAEKYQYDGLRFEVKNIADSDAVREGTDIVVSLHACDIATDLALFNAVKGRVKYVFCVPCCQHQLNASVKTCGNLDLMLSDGLIKERFSSLMTDAIRVKLLRALGYKVDVIEFVDFEHSPKNIMLRCVKSSDKIDEQAIAEVGDILKFTGAKQELFTMIQELMQK